MIDFESGTRRSVAAHVRTVIRTGLQQITNQISEKNLEMMSHCYVETSAHMGARPDHANWQGQQFYWAEKDNNDDNNSANYPDFVSETGYGSGAGLGGWNCRHSFYAYFPGISKPAYSKKLLKEYEGESIEYNGRTYTPYEASQRQRQLEREIRVTKRKIVGYSAINDTEQVTTQSIKLSRQRENYLEFSKAANLRPKADRIHEARYNRSISSKVVQARKRFEKHANDIFNTVDVKENKVDLLLHYRQHPFLQERLDFIDAVTNEKGFIPNKAIINYPKVIAQGESLRVRYRLVEKFGGEANKWQKKVGRVDSQKYMHDVHWYEYEDKQYEMKLKLRKERKR